MSAFSRKKLRSFSIVNSHTVLFINLPTFMYIVENAEGTANRDKKAAIFTKLALNLCSHLLILKLNTHADDLSM